MDKKILFNSAIDQNIPTFGVVVPFFWTGRSLRLLIGIKDAAKYFNVNIVFIQGYYTNQAYYYRTTDTTDNAEQSGQVIFDLISKQLIDGLIINTGCFRSHADKTKLLETCKRYEPIPMISVGSGIDGITNILIDNVRGIRKMMNHLIQVHKFQRIAIIRGPEVHKDSNTRAQTYFDVLKEYNIPIDNKLVSNFGTWNCDWVCEESMTMLKNNNNQIDAFLCFSDGHARAIIEHFKENGIRVPEDIAVVGFNDEPDAQACRPAITTVNLNLYDRGWYCVKVLHEYLNGTAMPESVTVNAPIIVRQSCGCATTGSRAIDSSEVGKQSTLSTIINTRESLLQQLKMETHNALNISDNIKSSQYSDMFIEIFLTASEANNLADFIINFSRILRMFFSDYSDISKWYWAINVLDSYMDRLLTSEKINLGRKLVDNARILVSELSNIEHKSFLINVIDRNAMTNSLSQLLSRTSDMRAVLNVLHEYLPQIGIHACYLSIYTDRTKPLEQSKLILAYNKQGRIDLPENGITFSTMQLIPQNLITIEQFKPLIVEPLFYGDQQLGFTLFEFGSQEKSFYELFTVQLSAAIWGSILFQKEQQTESKLKEQAEALSLTNDKLKQQAQELKNALDLLKNDQEKLLLSEKMAILGRLTASIAHEMNTPLAAVRASMMELRKLIKEYKESIDDTDISKEDHREIAREIVQAVTLSDKSATQATDFIKSIKIQTRDINKTEIEVFDISEIISSVFTFLTPSIKKYGCKTRIQKPDCKLQLSGSPSKMTQIITNLISNSIDAVAESAVKLVTVDISINDNLISLRISDTGCGIPPQNLAKIYDPMFSTKPFVESSGLGLSIVHDLIHKDFNGSISVESEVNKGTSFTLTFPIE